MRYKSLGIGLAAVLLFMLGMPLWHGWRAHPLASAAAVDVCALLRTSAMRELLEAPTEVSSVMPGAAPSPQSDPTCYIGLSGDDVHASRFIVTTLITEAGLAHRGGRQRSERLVEIWLAEAKSSGASLRESDGPWRRGTWIDKPGRGHASQLLLDEGGVVWVFRAEGVDPSRLAAFAAMATKAARQVSR